MFLEDQLTYQLQFAHSDLFSPDVEIDEMFAKEPILFENQEMPHSSQENDCYESGACGLLAQLPKGRPLRYLIYTWLSKQPSRSNDWLKLCRFHSL